MWAFRESTLTRRKEQEPKTVEAESSMGDKGVITRQPESPHKGSSMHIARHIGTHSEEVKDYNNSEAD